MNNTDVTLPDWHQSILLMSADGQAEIAREIPRAAADGRGYVTSERIAQDVREASALSPDGLVSVCLDGGRYRLATPGEVCVQAYVA